MKHLYFPEYKVEKESQRWNTDLASIHHAPLPLFRISNTEWRKKFQDNSLLSHSQFLVGCLCFRCHVCKTITRIASFPAQSGPPAKKLHFDRESVDFVQNLCVFPFFTNKDSYIWSKWFQVTSITSPFLQNTCITNTIPVLSTLLRENENESLVFLWSYGKA